MIKVLLSSVLVCLKLVSIPKKNTAWLLYFGTHFNVVFAPQVIVSSLEQKINETHKLSEGRLKQAQEAESMVIELKTAKQRCLLLFISILRV